MDWDVAQVVEHLLCNHKALISNHIPKKKKKKKKDFTAELSMQFNCTKTGTVTSGVSKTLLLMQP
jgi:hypothetical protein